MEEAFESLKKDGKNNLDSIIEWMKHSKLIDETEAAKEKIRKMFEKCKDKTNIQLAEFKEAMIKFAKDQSLELEDIGHKLRDGAGSLLGEVKKAVVSQVGKENTITT